MYILGIGTAFPDQSLSNNDLAQLGIAANGSQTDLVERAGVAVRRISVPTEHLSMNGSRDVLETWKVATATPTSLAVTACRNVMQSAGISIDSVGLLLADTATPRQTCPSEAQRIAGEFGVKIPAYDVVGGAGAVAHILATLSCWKEDRIPEYALCVSTNVPTQYVSYKENANAARIFGDAAVALLVSTKHVAGSRVVASNMTHAKKPLLPVVINREIEIRANALLSKAELAEFLSTEWLRVCGQYPEVRESAVIVPPQMYAAESAQVLTALGVAAERVVSGVSESGYSLGSAAGIALQKGLASHAHGAWCVVMHCGDSLQGSVVISPS